MHFVLLAFLVLACSSTRTPSESPASNASVPAAPRSTVVARPSDAAQSETASAVAAPPAKQLASGLDAVRACLTNWGELRLAPELAYQGISAKALATKLGFQSRHDPALGAFCEPELRESLCAYTDCATPGLAFTWKLDAAGDAHGATGLLIIEAPTGQASAYPIGNLELWEPEFACGCMGGSEFARVTRPEPDVVVVAYLAQTRPGRMCNESYSTSTWFLDEATFPVAAVFTNEPDTGPTAVEVRRAADEVYVRTPPGCEARVTWSELTKAALREIDQRPGGIRINL